MIGQDITENTTKILTVTEVVIDLISNEWRQSLISHDLKMLVLYKYKYNTCKCNYTVKQLLRKRLN